MKPVGYSALIDRYDLKGHTPWHLSYVSRGPRSVTTTDGRVQETYPIAYARGDADLDHLMFALKYDGVDLRLLKDFFTYFAETDLIEAMAARSHSVQLRRIWFLYEWLTRKSLPIPEPKSGNYGELLDPDLYVTAPLFRSQRHRIIVNTLGTSHYCPIIRKTGRLAEFRNKELQQKTGSLIQTVDATTLARATSYLYLKESQTSWDIERVQPNEQRMARFLGALRNPPEAEFDKQRIIHAHNAIVDPDHFETNYRPDAVYVADGPSIDYIAPRPEDVPLMMEALLCGVDSGSTSTSFINADMTAMEGGRGEVLRTSISIDPVIHAAVVGFGFVYIHPFADGNGRMHRFLLQQILARRGFSPRDFIIPVSPAILRDRDGYLRTLDRISSSIMPLIDYTRDQRTGRITIHNDTADLYRYPDLTAHAEFLYEKIENSIERDVQSELVYLQTYDRAQLRARLIHRLTDAQEKALLHLCFSEGRVSHEMRQKLFSEVKAVDMDRLETAVTDTIRECNLPKEFLQAQALDRTR